MGKFNCNLLIALISLVLFGCDQTTKVDDELTSNDQETRIEIYAQQSKKTLQRLFADPTNEYKPLTWYHVMNGNMSQAGITKDLESMAEVGIGGTILFNIGLNMPAGPVTFNTAQHIDLIGHMAHESKRLGLSFGLHNCDGWSSSGGPWITPEHSMKKVTWHETVIKIDEDSDINLTLKQPATLEGYYQDIAVLAYPSLDTELVDAFEKPTFSASDQNFDFKVLTDIHDVEYSAITSKDKQPVWLQFAYKNPVTIRFASLELNFGKHVKYTLEYSNDGINFTQHTDMHVNRPARIRWELDEAFEGVTAKYFRIVADKTMRVYSAHLSSTPKMTAFLGRTSSARRDYSKLPAIGKPAPQHMIDPASVRDLTADLSSNGQLNTQLPAGNWTIMRFGYTSTGVTNIPPTPAGSGLEVDKFSRASFKTHYDAYVTNVINKVKKVAPGVMHSLEIDSYEVGGQNWTQGYDQAFEDKYGYSLIPYLPLYAGKFIESPKVTEAVLWDTRDLSNQMIRDNYYQYFTELANKDGIKTYIEPYGFGPFNDVDVASKADIPMGEFWLKRDIYMMASSTSAAHIYNKNIVSAESFTALPEHNWHFNPSYGKFDGDKAWALGINQFVFHRFTHQANTHAVPGMTMERWGANLDRTQPWWRTAGKDWFTYIRRGQAMLRQGQPVSDVLWYLGDAAPTTCPDKTNKSKHIPHHINYDCLNREKLQTELSFVDGRLQLDHGVQYKVLRLTNHNTLYYQSVKKIFELAKQGAVIVGEPIKQLAGRNISPAQQHDFKRMVDFIWSQPNTHREADWDNIYKTHQFDYDLTVKGINKLYYAHRKTKDQDIYFVYNDDSKRKLFDATFNVTGKVPELWDAKTGTTKRLAAYETSGNMTKVAFRLNPEESTFIIFSETTDDMRSVNPKIMRDQDVEVVYDNQNQINLLAQNNENSAFSFDGLTQDINITGVPAPQILDSSWQVTFEKEYGLEQTFTFDKLINWKNSSNKAIQAYSGIATYQQSFVLNDMLLDDDHKIYINLGKVSDTAQVFINGQEVGVSWIAPFSLDATAFLKAGNNDISIKVATSWINRMITDEAYPDTSGLWDDKGIMVKQMPRWYVENKPLPAGKRRTFTTYKFVNNTDPLVDAGLLGPVTLNVVKKFSL